MFQINQIETSQCINFAKESHNNICLIYLFTFIKLQFENVHSHFKTHVKYFYLLSLNLKRLFFYIFVTIVVPNQA